MHSLENKTAQIIVDYFMGKPEVSAVFLFGSYAQGQSRPTSDIDIGILFESTDRAVVSSLLDQFHAPLARILRKDLDLVALNFASELLLKQVFSKGRCIFVNNSKKLAMFRMTAFTKIAEFGFYKSTFENNFAQRILNG